MPEESEDPDLLVRERGYYQEIKEKLLQQHEGEYALIKGRELLDVFDTPQTAYEEGIQRLGNVPMLIVRIQRQELTDWVPALQLGLIHADIQS